MKNIITILFIAIFSSFAFGEGAGNRSEKAENQRENGQSLPFTKQKWTLIEIDGIPIEGKNPVLRFNERDGSFVISICNHISGKYTLRKPGLRFFTLITTAMACREPLMKTENNLGDALKKVTKFKQTANSLIFFAGSKPVLKFISERQAALSKKPFENMKWVLISVGAGKISPQTPFPFLEFDKGEMQFSGFGGCNQLIGGYKTGSGQSLEFNAFVMPRMACADSVLDKTEREFSVALGKVNRYELSGGTLYLLNENALLLTFVSTKK